MDYCGLDLGRKSSRYCIVDKERNILRQGNVSTHEAGLRKLFNKQAPLEIVVEASCGAFWIAEMLMEMGHTVYVVDPNRTKAIGASLIKNDKLDARWLAYLCAAGLLAKVRVQTRPERIARMPSTSRDAVVRARTKLLNAVRGMAAAEGVSLRQSRPEKLVSLVDAAQEHLPDGMYDAMLPLLDAIEGPGKTMRRGRITKRGNRQARWALTMAANSLLLCKKSTPLVEWGKSLHKRVG
ncbi:MAG: transposase, partial [Proteobacteria bacterium]|nr:transposase [Pseudomonadota bacterium]